VKIYRWGQWPEHLLTKKQLNDAGFSTTPKLLPIPAGAVQREKSPNGLMFLYDRNTATPKRVLSDEEKAKRAEIAKRIAAKWHCQRCGRRIEHYRYGMGTCEECADHLSARDWARAQLDRPADEWVILDSETTGLDAGYNEIVELAVIDGRGKTLLDTRIKPLYPERMLERGESGICATDIHGIRPEMLEDAPTFAEVYADVFHMLHGKTVLIYNAPYDTAMLRGDRKRYSLPRLDFEALDVMVPYAEWCGERRRDGSYRWQKLNGGHSALSDCVATLKVLHEMAEFEKDIAQSVLQSEV
jgi:DNA polymerase-3 subunit epsilon